MHLQSTAGIESNVTISPATVDTIMKSPDAPPCLQHSRPTVLLVEDDPAVREITREVLKQNGYRVLEADGPESALQLAGAAKHKIDVLLTDLVMPGMNGSVLAGRLQALQPGLITVLMSGYGARAWQETHQLSPTTLYMQKPFTVESLCSKVGEAIVTKGAMVEQNGSALQTAATEACASSAVRNRLQTEPRTFPD
jgi:DNA-binding NtrC family response regulator